MHNGEYSGSELFPGSLRGYRAWNINPETLTLTAINASYGEWIPGVNEARCAAGESAYTKDKHTAPYKNHTCGFYCRYDPGDVDDIVGEDEISIYGAIDVHGILQLGRRGLRAQYAEIVALACKDIHPKIVNLFAEKYEVPVFETMEKLLAEYPRSDVSDLVPEEKPVEKVDLSLIDEAMKNVAAVLNMTTDQFRKLYRQQQLTLPNTGSLVYRPNEHITWYSDSPITWTNATATTTFPVTYNFPFNYE